MSRILVLLALVALGGCVTTPDYRYAGGGDYYYGDDYPIEGVYIGGYGAGNYYDYYDAGYYGYFQSFPWYTYAAPGYGFGAYSWGWGSGYGGYNPFLFGYWSSPWAGLWGGAWGGYWNSWAYTPYYWFVDRPDRARDLHDLHSEKVRWLGARRGAYFGGAAAATTTMRSNRVSRERAAATSTRRSAIRGESVRQSGGWHRQWPQGGNDAIRRSVTRPVMPRGTPARMPRSSPEHAVDRVPLTRSHRPMTRPAATRIRATPSRSYRPASRVRSAPAPTVSRARSSRSHSSGRSSTTRSYPRGTPSNDD